VKKWVFVLAIAIALVERSHHRVSKLRTQRHLPASYHGIEDGRESLTDRLAVRVALLTSLRARPAQSLSEDAVWAFKPTREGNAIVLAQRTASRPSREDMAQTAAALQAQWGWPASLWLKVFKPLVK
jgi:hypothetical protein